MSLYQKHRPTSFETVIGNEEVISSLQSLLNKKEHPHAYLLHGPTGCGKTTLGRIIGEVLGCKGRDFHEIDSADFRGIDTVREIRRVSRLSPLESPCSVYLLDECHKLSNDAMNALLKALEDTPRHVYYILCTTDPQKLLPTIRGRCSQFQVSLLTDRQMFSLLREIVKAEEEKISKTVYDQIIQDALGHPRNAISILEQVLAVPEEQRLDVAKRTAERQSQVIELCRALVQRKGGWKSVSVILNQLKGQDQESIRHAILGYCSAILLKGQNDSAATVMQEFIEPFYNTGWPGLVFACYSAVCGE